MATTPSHPSVNINLTDLPTVVAWPCPRSNDVLFLDYSDPTSTVSCTISIDSDQSRALIRLRIPVQLKGLRHRSSAFVYFSPRILRCVARELDVPSRGTTKLGAAVGLKLLTHNLPALVIPSDAPGDLLPKNRAAGEVLDLVRSLVQATAITVYLPSRNISKRAVDAICSTAWGSHPWPVVPSSADLQQLYSGKGGQLVPVVDPAPSQSRGSSPPSYDELALSPPPPPRPQKRPRLEPRVGASSDDRMRNLATQIFAERQDQLRDEIKEQLLADDALRDRLTRGILENLRDEVGTQIQQGMRGVREHTNECVARNMQEAEGRIWSRVEQNLEQMRSRLQQTDERVGQIDERVEQAEERIEAVDEALEDGLTHGVNDTIDLRIDDQMMSVKEELRDAIAEELKNAEDRIRDELDGMNFQISLST